MAAAYVCVCVVYVLVITPPLSDKEKLVCTTHEGA